MQVSRAFACDPAGRSIFVLFLRSVGKDRVKCVGRCMHVADSHGTVACAASVVYLVFTLFRCIVCDFVLSSIFVCERSGSTDELLPWWGQDKLWPVNLRVQCHVLQNSWLFPPTGSCASSLLKWHSHQFDQKNLPIPKGIIGVIVSSAAVVCNVFATNASFTPCTVLRIDCLLVLSCTPFKPTAYVRTDQTWNTPHSQGSPTTRK